MIPQNRQITSAFWRLEEIGPRRPLPPFSVIAVRPAWPPWFPDNLFARE